MDDEKAAEQVWRYFGRDSMSGVVYEIYRCPANGKRIEFQNMADVYLLLQDGTWRPNMRERLIGEIFKGDFAENCDEISEAEAMNYYRSWTESGKWPGRF
jgi:hypothetical protein